MARSVQLTIPNACHEKWHTMTPAQQGRYCMSCRKNVVDFTNMSDREILDHIANASAGVCGRFYPDQLNRDMIIQKKSRWPWMKYFFQFTLPAFLISMKAKEAVAEKQTTVHVQREPNEINVPVADTSFITVKGRVMDEFGEGVACATVMIRGTGSGTSTDTEGYFSIKCPVLKRFKLDISSVGYETKVIKIKPKNGENEKVVVLKMKLVVLGWLAVVDNHSLKAKI